jgi:hypothetical protein
MYACVYVCVCVCVCVTKEKKIESNFSTICSSKITKKQRAEKEKESVRVF